MERSKSCSPCYYKSKRPFCKWCRINRKSFPIDIYEPHDLIIGKKLVSKNVFATNGYEATSLANKDQKYESCNSQKM